MLRAKGVPIVRARLAALDEAYTLPASLFGRGEGIAEVGVVVNATALGAAGLIGVADPNVYPIRGQTVSVRAPAAYRKRCIMQTRAFAPGGVFRRLTWRAYADTSAGDPYAAKETAYVIPRAGPSREVILGGSYGPKNHITIPDLGLAERILQRAFALDPALAHRADGRKCTWRDIEVISHNVGLRPARAGGVRVEAERFVLGNGNRPLAPRKVEGRKRQVAVVHAYGIGPAGYQASWGIAERATALVMAEMAGGKAAAKL